MEFDEYIVDLNADCKCGCMDAGRFHKIYHFPNDYGASVVGNPKTPGFAKEGYRAMLLKFSGPETYRNMFIPAMGTNLVECENWSDVVKTLQTLKDLA